MTYAKLSIISNKLLTAQVKKYICFFALSCLLVSVIAPAAMAQNPGKAVKNTRYLALGDSLAFGFNPFVNPPDLTQYLGYPQLVSGIVHEKVANASCPGETTSSFISAAAPALPGFTCGATSSATVYAANGAPIQVSMPRYVPYNGAQTQLQYAVNYLTNNPNPKLVTIGIGGNDLAPLLTCTSGCDVLAAQLLGTAGSNLAYIFGALRSTGYTGPIIAVNYYAFNYNDPRQVGPSGAFTALNSTIGSVAALFNVKVADAFGIFQVASGPAGDPCAAGLFLRIPGSTSCDTHPSIFGQALISSAVTYQLGN